MVQLKLIRAHADMNLNLDLCVYLCCKWLLCLYCFAFIIHLVEARVLNWRVMTLGVVSHLFMVMLSLVVSFPLSPRNFPKSDGIFYCHCHCHCHWYAIVRTRVTIWKCEKLLNEMENCPSPHFGIPKFGSLDLHTTIERTFTIENMTCKLDAKFMSFLCTAQR